MRAERIEWTLSERNYLDLSEIREISRTIRWHRSDLQPEQLIQPMEMIRKMSIWKRFGCRIERVIAVEFERIIATEWKSRSCEQEFGTMNEQYE